MIIEFVGSLLFLRILVTFDTPWFFKSSRRSASEAPSRDLDVITPLEELRLLWGVIFTPWFAIVLELRRVLDAVSEVTSTT